MRALLAVLACAVAGVGIIVTSSPGSADSCSSTSGAGSSNFHTSVACSVPPAAVVGAAAPSNRPPGPWVPTAVCEPTPQGGCARQKRCPNGLGMPITYWESADGQLLDHYDNCSERTHQRDPAPTPAAILRAFQHLPLPDSQIVIQPPGGATLVNFDTNFYTRATPFPRTLTLLGHHLRFKIRATTFTWHFGDHTATTTHTPGAAYPTLDITHRYTTKGTVTPSVDTTWTADYQLDTNPWTPVDGTVTIPGTPQRLTIKTATPLLVG